MKTKNRNDEYDPMFSFRLPQKHFDAVVQEADKRGLKESDILREIVREWVEKKTGRV